MCVDAVKCINLCKYFVLFDNRGYHFCSVDCISILVLGINFCSHVDSKWVLYQVTKSQVLDFGCIAHLFESGLCQFLLLINIVLFILIPCKPLGRHWEPCGSRQSSVIRLSPIQMTHVLFFYLISLCFVLCVVWIKNKLNWIELNWWNWYTNFLYR